MKTQNFCIVFGIYILSIFELAIAQRDAYCYASDYEPYVLFSSKTPYEFVKGKENSHNFVADCQPILFWSFNRHGTRLPGIDAIEQLPKLMKTRDDIIANYEIRKTIPDQGRLCEQDIENFKNWVWNKNYTFNFANDLTYQGYDDLRYLAKRWQSRFPDILSTQYSPRHYLFRHTEKRCAKDSFRAFADGLFGRENFNSIRPQPPQANDSILQLNEFCDTWKNEVKNNPITLEQVNNLMKKEEYRNMIQNVSSHLGYRYSLDEAIIKNIYDMCRFDKAWEINKNSPWCAAFTKEQLRLLEYAEDLKYYYKSGYGNPLNKKLGCSPLKDMMDRFAKMVDHPEQDQPRAIVYLSQSTMLQSLLTALGIAEDSVPLLADNYHTPGIQRRKWRTSQIDPFASNLVAILHRCQSGEKHKVLFFLNEKPVEFVDCQVGLCSWELLKRKYSDAANQCNTKFCFKNAASDLFKYNSNIILISLIVIMLNKLLN